MTNKAKIYLKNIQEADTEKKLKQILFFRTKAEMVDEYEAWKEAKWRQIIWQNEEEELCMGWIQNDKLDKFKFPRKAQTGKSRKL